MGPTHRLWRARTALLWRLITGAGSPIKTFGQSFSKRFHRFVFQSDGMILPIAFMFFTILIMLNAMIKEHKGRKPASAAMVVEYRAKNECLHGMIPKIADENRGAPLLVKQLWKANNECAQAMEALKEKEAMDKALQ